MGLSTDYANVEQWQRGKPYTHDPNHSPPLVKHNGNVFALLFGTDETYEPAVGDASDKGGWQFYDELYDQTSHTPTDQAKIIAYIPTWRTKEGFNYANDELYQYITHGIIAFLTFSEINLGEFDPKSVTDVNAILLDVINAGHRNGTRISIALGGSDDYGFLNLMTSIGTNEASALLDKAVQNVVTFVESHNLDGVDLDLECWWGKPGERDQGGRAKSEGPHPAASALALFSQRLKHAMPEKLVSAAVFATSWFGNNYDSKIADYVDWLAIMTYDLTGSWNASPVGPHTALSKIRNQDVYAGEQQGGWPGNGPVNNPILSVEDSIWYWTNPFFVTWNGAGQKIPRNKIAAGVPLYGYDFAYGKEPDDRSGQVPPGYKQVRYKRILADFPDAHTVANGNIKNSGQAPRPPFISAPGNYPYANNIYFETPDTAVTKLTFLKNVGVQGVIIWELSSDVWEDGKSIIKALYRNSGHSETRSPLPGKAPVPSDILTQYVEQMRSYTNEFAAEIAQGRENDTSVLGLLVDPSVVGAIRQFFNDAGKPQGKGIKGEDADALIAWWREIEEEAKTYRADSPDAPSRITDLKHKADQLVQQVESRMRDEDGWLFAPFLSLITLIQAHILLEGFVRQNPAPAQEPHTDEERDKQKECEREADDISQQMQHSIDMLTNALHKWPTMDLGPVGSVVGMPGIPIPPAPPVEPPPPPPVEPPRPVEHRYVVEISVQVLPFVPSLTLQVLFRAADQTTKIASFDGIAAVTPGLPFNYNWEGAATLNYDVEWLMSQGWQATFDLDYGPLGTNMHLRGLSGEEVGSVTSSQQKVVIPAAAAGRGIFGR